jgi:Tol biopolymer transport system component
MEELTVRERKMIPLLSIVAWAILSGSLARLATAQTVNKPGISHSRIAFVQASPQTPYGDIFTMNPDGTGIQQLTSLGPNNQANSESWSADGEQFVFNEYPNFGIGQLWLMNSDGSNQHLLLAEAADGDYSPSFSPDGKWVVFDRCPLALTVCAIYRIRTDGSNLTAVTSFQLEVTDYSPSYSPDGTTIAFFSYARGGVLGAVYLTDPSGSNLRRVTPPVLGAYVPQWSTDGEKITVIDHCCDPQNRDVWQVRRDGSDLSRLTGSAATDIQLPVAYYDGNPSWSPDGRSVVFDQYLVSSNSNGIFVVKAGEGSSPPTPFLIRANAYSPKWGPVLDGLHNSALHTQRQ